MFLRVALFMMMALGLTGLGTVAWLASRPSEAASAAAAAEAAARAQPGQPVRMLVAAQPLRAGSLLKPEDVVAKDVKRADLPEGFSADTSNARSALVGAMLKRAIGKDEALLARDVMRPSEHGFLAAVVGQGMRAVTIGVDAVTGTAGLISPGDRVDVILTQVIEDQGLPVGRRVAAETVLTNARVVAIDQQIMQGEAARGGGDAHGHTVTLEATGDAAQRLTVAARIGRLSLTVRSADLAAGATIGANMAPIFASDVSRALAGQINRRTSGTLKVHPGSGDTREFKF